MLSTSPTQADQTFLTHTDIDAPTPKDNEVVVQVDVAGVNFIDVYFREGIYHSPLRLFLDLKEPAGSSTTHRARLLKEQWWHGATLLAPTLSRCVCPAIAWLRCQNP